MPNSLRSSASSKLAGTTSEVEQPEQISGIKGFFFSEWPDARPHVHLVLHGCGEMICTLWKMWGGLRPLSMSHWLAIFEGGWRVLPLSAGLRHLFTLQTEESWEAPEGGKAMVRTQERHLHFKCCKPWFWSNTIVNVWRLFFNSFFVIRHDVRRWSALWLSSRQHWQGRLVLARAIVFLRRALRHWTL